MLNDFDKSKILSELGQGHFAQRDEFSEEIYEPLGTGSIPPCYKIEDGSLIITDETVKIKNHATHGYSPTECDAEQQVLVHCTNFFPRNNEILSDFDGKKIGSTSITYRGVKKQVKALCHRHEVHFTINNRVENTGDGAGSWNNPNYIIVENYSAHQNEMDSTCPSDAWTNATSVKLSKQAVILVNADSKDKIPLTEQEINSGDYNIVYYRGDASRCLKNFIRSNGYLVYPTDPNYAGHAYSNLRTCELGLNLRDLAINYTRDEPYLMQQPIVLSQQELAPVLDVAISQVVQRVINNVPLPRENGFTKQQAEQYSKIVNFIITSGLIKTEHGYTFKSDEEVMADVISISNFFENSSVAETIKAGKGLITLFDVELANEVFALQQEYARNYEQMPLPSLEEISSMSLSDLYSFKNQRACEAFCHNLTEGFTNSQEACLEEPEGFEGGVDLKIVSLVGSANEENLPEDTDIEIRPSGFSDGYEIHKILPDSLLVSQVQQELISLTQANEDVLTLEQ